MRIETKLVLINYGWETVLIQRILIGFPTGILIYSVALLSAFRGYHNEKKIKAGSNFMIF